MSREIDVRGLSCPQPVLLVKKVIDAGESEFTVLVGDKVALENIKRLAKNSAYNVEIEKRGKDTILKLTK